MQKQLPKILFILHTPPPVHGSSMVGKFIQESRIINHEFNCKYINLGTSGTIAEIGKGDVKKVFRYLSILLRLSYQLTIFRPNLCYLAITAQGLGFYKDSIVALIIRLYGVKCVYHFHNKGIKSKQEKRFDNFLYKLVFKQCFVILLSKYLLDDVEKYIDKATLYYCPNGIPLETIETNRERTKNDIVEILFVSNLIESKGVFVLLHACDILNKRNIPFKCTFVGGNGDISTKQLCQKIKYFKLSEQVRYVGKKYGKDKEVVFKNADIFAFPTFYHNETFGLVNLEAMQHSLPVVSTFEGGIPEVVENDVTGFLVQKNDPIVLADKLELLIKNPELRMQMGQAGRRRYEEKFTLEKFENNLKNILAEIIEKINTK